MNPPSTLKIIEKSANFRMHSDARGPAKITDIVNEFVGKCTQHGYLVELIRIESVDPGLLRMPILSGLATYSVTIRGWFIIPRRGMIVQGAYVQSATDRGMVCAKSPFKILVPPNFTTLTADQYIDIELTGFKDELTKPVITAIGMPYRLFDIPKEMRHIGFYQDDPIGPYRMTLSPGDPEPFQDFQESQDFQDFQNFQDFRNLPIWARQIRLMLNPYELIHPPDNYGTRILPEKLQGNPRPISRAYYKLVDVVHQYQWKMEPDDIAVCLADAPGGMTQAMTHLFPNRVFSTSLLDGIVYSPELSKNPRITIDYLDSGTGDLLDAANIRGFLARLPRRAKLISADGAIEYLPTERENIHHRLLLGEILAALSIQEIGGSFFVKLFGRRSLTTIRIFIWASQWYDSWHLIKPRSVRIANNEVLAVFNGLRRIPDISKELEEFRKFVDPDMHITGIEVPGYILDRVKNFNEYMMSIRNFELNFGFNMSKHKFDPDRFINEQTEYAKKYLD